MLLHIYLYIYVGFNKYPTNNITRSLPLFRDYRERKLRKLTSETSLVYYNYKYELSHCIWMGNCQFFFYIHEFSFNYILVFYTKNYRTLAKCHIPIMLLNVIRVIPILIVTVKKKIGYTST